MANQPNSLEQALGADIRKFNMGIGECVITNMPMLVRTVLGSCVTATFFHNRSKLSGAFHAVLPRADLNSSQFCKFVDSAVAAVVFRFIERGVPASDVEVKLFGGANKLTNPDGPPLMESLNVGRKNVVLARELLENLGFAVGAEDVLGTTGRTLFFSTCTGQVWVKKHAKNGRASKFTPLPLEKDCCRYIEIK